MGTYFVYKMGRWCLFSFLCFLLHKMDTYYYYTECRYLLQNGYTYKTVRVVFVFLLLLLHNGYFKQNGYFLQNDSVCIFFIFIFILFFSCCCYTMDISNKMDSSYKTISFFVFLLLLLHNGYFIQNGSYITKRA